jgi:NACHT domain
VRIPRRLHGRARQPGRQLRHTGKIVVVLLIVSVGTAIVIAHRYRLGVPQTLITVLLGGGAPAGLYLTWATFLHQYLQSEHFNAERKTLPEIAEDLAGSIGSQWNEEVVIRQFNDYGPLFVSWVAADPSLSVGWKDLVSVADNGPGRLSRPRADTWAAGPNALAGSGRGLPGVLKRVPTGWLVVLGEPGSGKTMLMVRLVLDLLARRKSDEPVPVLVPITSWDPRQLDLLAWLEERLCIDHPGLAAPASAGTKKRSRVSALLAERMIFPILDGLDEMPPAIRRAAIARINEMLARRDSPRQLIVTCRAAEYHEAVGRPGKSWNPLRGAAAIELQPLDAEHVTAYLSEDSKDIRWKRVTSLLGKPTAVGKALRTPLTVSLAAAIYNPHQDEPVEEAPNPNDLRKRHLYRTADDICEHLFDAFIPAAYRSDPGRGPDAQKWLTFLAGYLTWRKTTSLRWWDLKGIAPSGLVPAVVGVICGIATAVPAGLGTHVGVGIGVGFGTGMLIALAIGLGIRYATHFNGRPGGGMAGALAGATIGGIAAGLAGKLGIGHEASLFSGLTESLGIGIGAGASTRFIGGLIGGLIGGFVAGFLEGVGLGFPAGLVNGLGVGLAAGLAVWYVGRRQPAQQRPEWKPIGLAGGLVIGMALGLIAWREEGVAAGLIVGAVIGGFSSWPLGLRDTDENLNVIPSPGAALTRDARAFRHTALAAGLAAAAAGFFGESLSSVFETGATANLTTIIGDGLGVGLASGLVIGLVFGFYHAASPGFLIISWWLALRRRTPWRLRRFLDDAHKKSVLRQSGADYQFRHEQLQRHLALSDPGRAWPRR